MIPGDSRGRGEGRRCSRGCRGTSARRYFVVGINGVAVSFGCRWRRRFTAGGSEPSRHTDAHDDGEARGRDERASEARGSPETAEDGGGNGGSPRTNTSSLGAPGLGFVRDSREEYSGVYMGALGDRIPHESWSFSARSSPVRALFVERWKERDDAWVPRVRERARGADEAGPLLGQGELRAREKGNGLRPTGSDYSPFFF